jgi:hypothetical protein
MKALALIVLLARGAHAYDVDVVNEHGVSCQPEASGTTNAVVGEPGTGNLSRSAPLRVFCPSTRAIHSGSGVFEPRIQSASVSYVDSSTSQPFWCYVWATNGSAGSQHWSTKKFTCAKTGGCFTVPSTFTGQGSLSWYLPFGNPRISEMGVSCSIPPIERGGSSWVNSYWFQLAPWDQW